MSWNFPLNHDEQMEFFRQNLNFLKGEVERLWKTMPLTPENGLGIPLTGPLSRDLNDVPFSPDEPGSEGGAGGSSERVVFIGKTQAAGDKSSVATVPVQLWWHDGSNNVSDGSEPVIQAYPYMRAVAAGKFCSIIRDTKSGKFYITGCECT